MGSRLNIARIKDGKLVELTYKHWGADNILGQLARGELPERDEEDDKTDGWLDDVWAEGGVLLDEDDALLLYFGGMDDESDGISYSQRIREAWAKNGVSAVMVDYQHEITRHVAARDLLSRRRFLDTHNSEGEHNLTGQTCPLCGAGDRWTHHKNGCRGLHDVKKILDEEPKREGWSQKKRFVDVTFGADGSLAVAPGQDLYLQHHSDAWRARVAEVRAGYPFGYRKGSEPLAGGMHGNGGWRAWQDSFRRGPLSFEEESRLRDAFVFFLVAELEPGKDGVPETGHAFRVGVKNVSRETLSFVGHMRIEEVFREKTLGPEKTDAT
jgi:hypothetical protein